MVVYPWGKRVSAAALAWVETPNGDSQIDYDGIVNDPAPADHAAVRPLTRGAARRDSLDA